jgi:hypothetical protein
MNELSCTRDDIEAFVSVSVIQLWAVSRDGSLRHCLDSAPDQVEQPDEYVCRNCDEFFVPDTPGDELALARAWAAALDHLSQLDDSHMVAYEVSSGATEVAARPDEVDIETIDHDNEAAGEVV